MTQEQGGSRVESARICSLDCAHLVQAYLFAKDFVCAKGYAGEVEWQDLRSPEEIDERTFLREAAWVVLASGMRETVIRNLFDTFSHAFFDWQSAKQISENRRRVRRDAMQVFGHSGKVDAIISLADHVTTNGIACIAERLRQEGSEYLTQFPYLGPATSCHLAKNLGLEIAKPDRHLVRIAAASGCDSVRAMCTLIATCVGDRIAVVDLVIWRFATLHGGYRALFTPPPVMSLATVPGESLAN